MRISDWSSDVCSSDLEAEKETWQNLILHQESMKPPRIGLRLRHRQEAPPRRDEPRCPPGHRQKEIEPADEEHQPMRRTPRSEEHTSELQPLMRNSYAVFRLKKTTN